MTGCGRAASLPSHETQREGNCGLLMHAITYTQLYGSGAKWTRTVLVYRKYLVALTYTIDTPPSVPHCSHITSMHSVYAWSSAKSTTNSLTSRLLPRERHPPTILRHDLPISNLDSVEHSLTSFIAYHRARNPHTSDFPTKSLRCVWHLRRLSPQPRQRSRAPCPSCQTSAPTKSRTP